MCNFKKLKSDARISFHSWEKSRADKIKISGALIFYRRALAVTGPNSNSEMKDIHRNMAAVFLALECYEDALEEAMKSMEAENSQKREKSMSR